MFKKLRDWFSQDSKELVAEENTMTPSEKRELTDYEDQKVDTSNHRPRAPTPTGNETPKNLATRG